MNRTVTRKLHNQKLIEKENRKKKKKKAARNEDRKQKEAEKREEGEKRKIREQNEFCGESSSRLSKFFSPHLMILPRRYYSLEVVLDADSWP